VAMEGPAFSTRAESHLYRLWGAHVIGMTALPEAKLAREAEICYATLACVTDYDCWREATDAVTVDVVLEILRKNAALSQDVLRRAVPSLSRERECACPSALRNAIVTASDSMPEETKRKVAPIIEKYLT